MKTEIPSVVYLYFEVRFPGTDCPRDITTIAWPENISENIDRLKGQYQLKLQEISLQHVGNPYNPREGELDESMCLLPGFIPPEAGPAATRVPGTHLNLFIFFVMINHIPVNEQLQICVNIYVLCFYSRPGSAMGSGDIVAHSEPVSRG